MTDDQTELATLMDMSLDIPLADRINDLERCMLDMPQAECPVVHHFGPGLYIREMAAPAGALLVGHAHKHEHMNVLLKGKVIILNEIGVPEELVAPAVFVAKPGRKVAYVTEDMVWQNIYATEETDLDKLEEMFIDKSEAWLEHHNSKAIQMNEEA